MTGKIDPGRQFILDLQAWLMFYINQGVEIILYLDGNEDITNTIGNWCEVSGYPSEQHIIAAEHDGSLATLVATCGLIDVLKEQFIEHSTNLYSRETKVGLCVSISECDGECREVEFTPLSYILWLRPQADCN